MKPTLLLVAASGIAFSLAACGRAPPPRASLDCPAKQGDLTRVSAAADGRSCVYSTAEGAEVTLQLLPVRGSAYATLDELESRLSAEAEAAAANAPKIDTKPSPQAASDAARAADQAAKDAVQGDVGDAESESDVGVDGSRGVIVDDKGATRVNLPGIHIEADDANDSARVQIGPLHIDANGEEAEIRIRRSVRLKGEALSTEKRGIRATYLSHSEGDRFVGYEAAGPKTGPLTVAVIRSKEHIEDGDGVYGDVKRLVRLNGGV
ncbi:hypothetical protein [Phenylobacterium sp.]|uniref:hypothetical protein n=1 Tax=Phenylobacterium sp. TaxID=1871053 RepID=UPI00394F2889